MPVISVGLVRFVPIERSVRGALIAFGARADFWGALWCFLMRHPLEIYSHNSPAFLSLKDWDKCLIPVLFLTSYPLPPGTPLQVVVVQIPNEEPLRNGPPLLRLSCKQDRTRLVIRVQSIMLCSNTILSYFLDVKWNYIESQGIKAGVQTVVRVMKIWPHLG